MFCSPSQARSWNRAVREGISENVLLKLKPIKRGANDVKNAEARAGRAKGMFYGQGPLGEQEPSMS